MGLFAKITAYPFRRPAVLFLLFYNEILSQTRKATMVAFRVVFYSRYCSITYTSSPVVLHAVILAGIFFQLVRVGKQLIPSADMLLSRH
jgi:hypothetical protein